MTSTIALEVVARDLWRLTPEGIVQPSGDQNSVIKWFLRVEVGLLAFRRRKTRSFVLRGKFSVCLGSNGRSQRWQQTCSAVFTLEGGPPPSLCNTLPISHSTSVLSSQSSFFSSRLERTAASRAQTGAGAAVYRLASAQRSRTVIG